MNQFSLKKEWPSLAIIIASFILGFYFYNKFPDRVVTHWGFNGQPDGWSGKFFGSIFIPILLVGMYVFFKVFPLIDPKRDRYQSFIHVYDLIRNLIILVLFTIFLASGLYNLGYKVSIAHIVSVAVGLMLIVIGNYLGKIQMNWFMGIRTPWTMSSEEVWNKTNRVGGWMMILFGLIIIVVPFLPPVLAFILFLIGVLLFVPGVFVYSYLAYVKEKKKNQQP